MPARRPFGAQVIGQAYTTALRGLGERPRPNGGYAGTRGPATPARLPCGAQVTGHAPTAAIQGTGGRPSRRDGHAGLRGPATPHGGHAGQR